MVYLKYISYLYLIMAGFFIYSGIAALIEKDNSNAIISFIFGGAAVFMFFFRRWSQGRMQGPKK